MATTPRTRKRSFPVKPEALSLMEEKMRKKGFKFTTQEEMYAELAEKAGLNSSDTIKNVFNPQYKRNPERNTVQSIASVLGLYPWDIVEGWNPPESLNCVKSASSDISILNRRVFQEMLDKQRELTANPLIKANFEASQLYVPLGLVEGKKQEQRKDVNPEMGSRLYRPEEYKMTRKFANDEFLMEVLLQGESPKSKGKRIAIIGEPGSGKTTRLQQFADRLFHENDESLVIWVSLADLQDKNLEDFLLNTWLKIALKQKEASEESQNKLIEKFNEGNIWLLLDGLDEMRLDHNPLHWVNSQIKGWIESAKIILTCRVNVWESGNNYLHNFDVYRNLDFSESQRDEFIYKFFNDHGLAEQLITALNQDGQERIRDLVKNPLRLTLICYSWEKHQGSLPETKAGLYQECVEAFYHWKEVEFQTTIAQQKALNRALGELAKQALEQESSKFRLTHRFVCDVLGESDKGLFKLALDLGWLNRVGVAEENPNEQVYAFFHPSFQEYFASLIIDDWDYFISRTRGQLGVQSILEGNYKIFDNNIKEISMYWIGRENISQRSKEEFIEGLLNFNPGKRDTAEDLSNLVYILFEGRAYSIAIELFAELPRNASTSSLVGKIVAVLCDHVFDDDKYKNLGLDIETSWVYKDALAKLKSNDQLVLKLIDYFFGNQVNVSSWIKYNALDLLDQLSMISDKSKVLINDLFDKITKREDYAIQWKFIDLTQEYISNPQKAQGILRDIIHEKVSDEYDSQFFLINCLYTLEKMKIYNENNNNILTIGEFLKIIHQTKNIRVCWAYLHALSLWGIRLQLKKAIRCKVMYPRYTKDSSRYAEDSYYEDFFNCTIFDFVILNYPSSQHCLSKKISVDPENINDLFSFIIELVSLKDEYIEQQYPERYNNNFNWYSSGGIKPICLEIAKRSINNNNKKFINIIFKKIEDILVNTIDLRAPDFRYNLLNLLGFLVLGFLGLLGQDYEVNSRSSKYVFLDFIGCLVNHREFISNATKEEISRLNSLINEAYAICSNENNQRTEKSDFLLYELDDSQKENLIFIVGKIMLIIVIDHSFIIDNGLFFFDKNFPLEYRKSPGFLSSYFSEFWCLLEVEKKLEVLNYIKYFKNLFREESEKHFNSLGISREEMLEEARTLPEDIDPSTLNNQEFERLKQGIEIDFQPNSNKDIIFLTNYLLGANLKRFFGNNFILRPPNIKNRGGMALYNLQQTNDPKLLQEIVFRLKPIFIYPQDFDSVVERRHLCLKALWHCANQLTYQEFVSAWFSVKSAQRPHIHPEVTDYTSIGGNTISQTLNQQILDLPSQLKPTEKTYPIIINAQSLEDETDNGSIAQELCNQIYAIAFPDETDIPEINNAPQLKRLIPNIKKQLNTQNLVLIFHNGEPNESLTKFCKKLTDVIPIKWITEQPIEYGIPPQNNLVNILQNWINELD